MKLLLVAMLMVFVAVSANAEGFLISDGNVAKAAIAISRNATEPMRVGASEIQKHIEMMSGAKLPIIEVSNVLNPIIPVEYNGMIVISNQETDPKTGQPVSFHSEEYTIRTVEGKPFQIRISGDNKRGAIYGCFTFLEDVLGCRWYTPTITKVPKRKIVSVKNLWIRQRPSFEYREPFFFENFDKMWAVHNKTNGNTQRLDDSVGGKVSYGRFVHTFSELVPQSYFAEHPEYFSMVNGKRMPGYAQLCLTNPDVLRIAIGTVRGWLQNDTKSVIFSVSQNDTGYACECDKCSAVVKEEGAQSGPILRFVNAIADNIAKDYPNVLIDTLAYSYSEAPPKLVKPRPNVRIRMCPISNCVGHPMNKCERDVKPFANLKAWSKITNQLYIWHYSTDFGNYLMPLPSLDDMETSVPLYKKYGAVGLFYQGSYQSNGGALAELKSYLLSKLMWDYKRNPKPIIKDYLQGVYGKAAPVMGEWVDLLHSEVRKNPHTHAFIYDSTKNGYLTDAVMAKSYVLLDKAAKIVADDPVASTEVQKARMWMQYVSLANNNSKYSIVGDEYKAVGDQVDRELKSSFVSSLNKFGVTLLSEGGGGIEGFMASLENNSAFKAYNFENENLKVTVVPAIGGRIVAANIKKNNINIFKESSGVLNLASGGYEEYFNHEYHGPGYSEPYVVDNATSNSVTMHLDKFSPIMVSRKISLDGTTITVSTSATNNGSSKRTLDMRTHPELFIPAKTKASCTFVDLSGKTINVPFPESEENIFYSQKEKPNGKWTVDLGSYSVTNTFDPKLVSQVLLNATTASQRYNFELYSTDIDLGPGQTVTFTNSFQVDVK